MSAEPRRVPSELRGRRLFLSLIITLIVPGALGVIALSYQRPEPPPVAGSVEHEPLAQVPDAVALAQLERSRRATRAAKKLPAPALLQPETLGSHDGPAGPAALSTLALPPRDAPYTIAELRNLVPSAFDTAADGQALLVRAHLEVPKGSTLVIDVQSPDVRLVSAPQGFATIISRGRVNVVGSAEHPVRISSWDPQREAVDSTTSDGRAFVLQLGGRMDVDRGRFEYLGFGTGTSSGVAWRGAAPDVTGSERIRAQGEVRSSVFSHNQFGAYTHEAEGMRWVGNTFADNIEYGLDPHDFSSGFLVEGNTAHGNGKHGFIFSRGCEHNVMRGNHAYDNNGHGFMIDDGRSRQTEFAQSRRDPSNDNVVADNVANDNAGSGIEIEGGTGNVVTGNHLTGNYIGVRVKDGAAVTVRDNTIVRSYRYGIDILGSADHIPVTRNAITGAWAAINLNTASSATLTANTSSDVSTPLVIDGVATRDTTWVDRVARYVLWNPLLVLWALVLGLPVIATMLRLIPAPLRAQRRRVPVS